MSNSPTAARRRFGLFRILVLLYLALLAASHVVRALRENPEPNPQLAVRLQAVDAGRRLAAEVTVAYRDTPARGSSAGLPILLLHGSPGSKDDLRGLEPALTEGHRVFAPDLPGFGESTRDVPDYSIRAHADYVLQLMDRLGLERCHFVGFSMGGGVVLEIYRVAPDRVASLTLLSAIGVQELELFGDYRMNHLVHAAQLAAIVLLREALPHFGKLDDSFLGLPYARNFYDTDQRPLRSILSQVEPPMLVLHGERDFLVPVEAAREHHRLVPQSELIVLPASHFLVFFDADNTGRRISEFVGRVERGEAQSRASADLRRITESERPFDPTTAPRFVGFALILMTALIAVATWVSEDLACIGAGLLVAQGRLEFLPAVLACVIGIFLGDVGLFFAGRWLGRPALRRVPLRWFVSPEHVELSSTWFRRRGAAVIVLSRFLPGTRLPTYFAAGMLQTSFWRFAAYFLAAVAVWTPLLVGLAMLVGERAFGYVELFQRHALLALLLLGLWILALLKLVVPLFSFRGRRLLVGRWRRLVNWEFWPLWAFYPPVFLWIVYLGLRHRGPLVFTAANPSMPAGGFIAESKADILAGLSGAGDLVARTGRLPRRGDVSARAAWVRRFMADNGLDFPIVLKPDAGQRGSGVAIVRDPVELQSYVEQSGFDAIAQEYVAGAEFGVFYVRRPGQESGRIFSITEKKMPFVVGDGERTVEQLILLDARAVCLSDHYLRYQRHQLSRVPAAGEQLELVELGTHCRGAIFLDGAELCSPELTRLFDRISRSYAGFHFGRYDVRAKDRESLRAGRDLKIIELNGVTSEATHIYDPRIGLVQAYRTLFEQWSLAFEIGSANRSRGVAVASLRELAGLLRDYRRSARTHP